MYVRYVYMETVSVAPPGPPPVITHARSKTANAWTARKITATKTKGSRCGHVTWRNFAHVPPPSISTASYRSFGMFCNPADRTMNTNGVVFHTSAATIANIAVDGEPSQ